jgi:hypothetical protein
LLSSRSHDAVPHPRSLSKRCAAPPQILEMAFAGNCGVEADLAPPASDPHGPLASLFAEELGLVLEVAPEKEAAVLAAYAAAGVPAAAIGASRADQTVELRVGGAAAVSGTTPALRDVWEATSFQLERLQAAEECVEAEQAGLASRRAPQWRLPFTPEWTPADKLAATGEPTGGPALEPGPGTRPWQPCLASRIIHWSARSFSVIIRHTPCRRWLCSALAHTLIHPNFPDCPSPFNCPRAPPTHPTPTPAHAAFPPKNPPPPQARCGWLCCARRAPTATARWRRRCTRRAWSPGTCT